MTSHSRARRASAGFTLVETLVAAGLSVAVLAAVLAVYVGQQRNFLVGNTYIAIHKEARTAMDWIARDIRWAIEVVPSHGSHATGDACLVLKVPSIDGNGDILDVANDHDYIIYRLQPGAPDRLERIVDGKDGVSSRQDETRVVAGSVHALAFRSNAVGLGSVPNLGNVAAVDTTLTTRQAVLSTAATDTLTSTSKLRNKG
ncbi:MAG: hypothetical protein PHN82_06835 [bacterium]|nr:hypothetical protein [bacterium]